jgi:YegS/Rv2252/BmrU family lipid kinase
MSMPQAKVIINPAAGARSTFRKWPRISQLLKHIGLSFDYQYTEGVGHAIELAREAASNGYQKLVAVGGDGTVNEVANGILHVTSARETALGVISTGTGSDFARSVGIPRYYVSACSSLTSSRRLVIDVGVVECQKNGKSIRRFFVNAAGVGFDAAVAGTTERLPKHFGGTIPYLTGLFYTLSNYRNKPVVLRIGDSLEEARILSLVVANGSYFSGGMKVAPEAGLTDNLLDVVVIGDIGKFDLMKSLPMVYKGTHGNHPKVTMAKATAVSTESSEPVLVHADGEVVGEGPASFWIMPGALSIVI